MARKLDDVMAALPKDRQKRVQARAMELVTLKDLRQAVQQTQEQMAAAYDAPVRGKHGRKAGAGGQVPRPSTRGD